MRSDGLIRDTRVYYVPDIDHTGTVNGFVSVIADITASEEQRCDETQATCRAQCAACENRRLG